MPYNYNAVIRKIENFPKEGILFYDITGMLQNPESFKASINETIDHYKNSKFDAIAAVESRGFIFASVLAYEMNLPLILIRKPGKLPNKTIKKIFNLEYGSDALELQLCDITKGQNILLVDDLLATGGTLEAAASLLEEAGAKVKDIFCPIGLPFLGGYQKLNMYNIKTLIEYTS